MNLGKNSELQKLERLFEDYRINQVNYSNLNLLDLIKKVEFEFLIHRTPHLNKAQLVMMNRLTKQKLLELVKDLQIDLMKSPSKKKELINLICGYAFLERKEYQLNNLLNKQEFQLLKKSQRKTSSNSQEMNQSKKTSIRSSNRSSSATSTRSSKPSSKKISLTEEQREHYRKKWLTFQNLDELYSEIARLNTTEIRAVVFPWKHKVKGRSKKELINSTIKYVKKMRQSTQLGKY